MSPEVLLIDSEWEVPDEKSRVVVMVLFRHVYSEVLPIHHCLVEFLSLFSEFLALEQNIGVLIVLLLPKLLGHDFSTLRNLHGVLILLDGMASEPDLFNRLLA